MKKLLFNIMERFLVILMLIPVLTTVSLIMLIYGFNGFERIFRDNIKL